MRRRAALFLAGLCCGLSLAAEPAMYLLGEVHDNPEGHALRPHVVYRIANALMKTNFANPNWLLEYWTRERLMSVDARRAWLEPDLKPLPF